MANDDKLIEIIKSNQVQNSTLQQYGVSQTPFHIHNGIDSPKIDYNDLNNIPAATNTSPGGSDTDVQFNDAGIFGGVGSFTFNKTSGVVTIANELVVHNQISVNTLIEVASITNIGGGNLSISTVNATTAGNITIKAGNGSSGGSVTISSGTYSSADTTIHGQRDVNITTVDRDINISNGSGGRDINLTANRNINITANTNNANFLVSVNGDNAFLDISGGGVGAFFVVGPTDSSSILVMQKNVGINATDFGGGYGALAILDAYTVPTTPPAGGGVLYSSGGALHWLGSSGTDTVIAPA